MQKKNSEETVSDGLELLREDLSWQAPLTTYRQEDLKIHLWPLIPLTTNNDTWNLMLKEFFSHQVSLCLWSEKNHSPLFTPDPVFCQHTKASTLNSSIILTYFGTEQLPLCSNVPLSNLLSLSIRMLLHLAVKKHQPTGTCAASTPQMERLITLPTVWCRWFMGNCDRVVITTQKCICGMARRLNGTAGD